MSRAPTSRRRTWQVRLADTRRTLDEDRLPQAVGQVDDPGDALIGQVVDPAEAFTHLGDGLESIACSAIDAAYGLT